MHLRCRRLLFAILTPVLFAIPASLRAEEVNELHVLVPDKDWYAVYSVVLPNVPMISAGGAQRYVIVSETWGLDTSLVPDASSESKLDQAIAAYMANNETHFWLRGGLTLTMPYDIVPLRDINAAIIAGEVGSSGPASGSPGGTRASADTISIAEGFTQRFPGARGYVWLSAVGYSKDRTMAVMSVDYTCGKICRGTQFYVLEKKDGSWVVSSQNDTW